MLYDTAQSQSLEHDTAQSQSLEHDTAKSQSIEQYVDILQSAEGMSDYVGSIIYCDDTPGTNTQLDHTSRMKKSDFIICFVSGKPEDASREYIGLRKLAFKMKENQPNRVLPVLVGLEEVPADILDMQLVTPINTSDEDWVQQIIRAMKQTPASKIHC